MANRYLAAKPLAQSRHEAHVPTGITCGKGMTKGALQPFSQSLGSHPCAFFSLLVDGCRFRAFPSLNQWAGCQRWSCASAQPCEAARHGDGARGHRALLAAFGGNNPNFPFFPPSSGSSCKTWKIITLWNRFDFLPGLLSLPDTIKTWGFWRKNFITRLIIQQSTCGFDLGVFIQTWWSCWIQIFFFFFICICKTFGSQSSAVLPFGAAHADMPFVPLPLQVKQ